MILAYINNVMNLQEWINTSDIIILYNTIIIDHITDRVCVCLGIIHVWYLLKFIIQNYCYITSIINMCFNVNVNITKMLTSYTEWCASIVLLLLPRYRFTTSSFTGHHHTTIIIGISTKYYYIVLYYIILQWYSVWITKMFI